MREIIALTTVGASLLISVASCKQPATPLAETKKTGTEAVPQDTPVAETACTEPGKANLAVVGFNVSESHEQGGAKNGEETLSDEYGSLRDLHIETIEFATKSYHSAGPDGYQHRQGYAAIPHGSLVRILREVKDSAGTIVNVDIEAIVASDAGFDFMRGRLAGDPYAPIGDKPQLLTKIGCQPYAPFQIKAISAENFWGSYTYYSNSPNRRAFNVNSALQRLSGSVIPNGQEFSYLHGMHWHPRLSAYPDFVSHADKYANGVCGTSTTLHRLVTSVGLPVVHVNNHEQIFYGDLYDVGAWDAMVYWLGGSSMAGDQDYKFLNDSGGDLVLLGASKLVDGVLVNTLQAWSTVPKNRTVAIDPQPRMASAEQGDQCTIGFDRCLIRNVVTTYDGVTPGGSAGARTTPRTNVITAIDGNVRTDKYCHCYDNQKFEVVDSIKNTFDSLRKKRRDAAKLGAVASSGRTKIEKLILVNPLPQYDGNGTVAAPAAAPATEEPAAAIPGDLAQSECTEDVGNGCFVCSVAIGCNLRGDASTTNAPVGTLGNGKPAAILGSATDSDGKTWFKVGENPEQWVYSGQ